MPDQLPQYDHDAEAAARSWLALADAADAAGTWTASAPRSPLGAVVSRTLRDARPATELPGAPDGEYVVFQFDTRFEHKRTAVETVTPMKDSDGAWRVSGYFIR